MDSGVKSFSLFVPGIPQPAGSKTAFIVHTKSGKDRAIITDAAKKSRPWKSQVSAMAADAWPHAPLDGPVELMVTFTMPRPKGHFGRKKGEPYLKPTAPGWHTGKPDATKLLRAVEDALNGIVWTDDSRVASQTVQKLYGERTGAAIKASLMSGTDQDF